MPSSPNQNPTVGVHGNPSTRKDAPIHQELSHSTAGDPKDGSRNVSKGLKDTPYNPSSERFTMGTGQITEEPQELPSSTPTELHHPEGSTVIKDVLVGDQPYSEVNTIIMVFQYIDGGILEPSP